MENKTIIVTAVERPPYAIFDRDSDGNLLKVHGLIFDIINIVASHMNFSYEVTIPPDNEFGAREPNGSWSGMIGLLTTKKADLAAALMSVSEERAEVLDFTTPLWQEAFGVLLAQPKGKINSEALLYPFSFQTWVALVAVSIVIGPIIYITKNKEDDIVPNQDHPNYKLTLGSWMWYTLGVLLNQVSKEVLTDSCRILCLTWSIFVFLLSSFYTANLIAYVAIPKYDFQIKQLEDLVATSGVKWLSRKGSYLMANILTPVNATDESIHKRLFNKMRLDVDENRGAFIDDDLKAEDFVLGKGYIYVREKTILQSMVAKDVVKTHRCRYRIGVDSSLRTSEAIGFQKGSEIRKVFDRFIDMMHYHGLINGLRKIHTPHEVYCPVNSHKESESAALPLGLASILAPSIVLLIGSSSGLVILIAECIIHKRRHKNSKQIRSVTWASGT